MIDTAFAWLNVWWSLMALPGLFWAGMFLGWLWGREDRLHLQRNWERAVANHAEAQAEANDLRAEVGIFRRDWQALRAIVEQHTVKP